MAELTLNRVSKKYANGFEAVNDVDLTVEDGEFLVLVGPSGCGKSTLLRAMAGLEDISSGTLAIDGRVVNHETPRERDVAMVFQNYALYPHMSVRKNIGYSLRLAKLDKSEIARRVEAAAELLELTDLLERKPGMLSGGQRQRVAMGRAIVREPAAYFMDEPLSNLDAKLRVQMRAEIARLQRTLGVTTVYVTHDQVEAMTMGTRVAVMKGGVLQQVAAPQDLYRNPKNAFVASFIGSPSMNLFEGTVTQHSPGECQVALGHQTLVVPSGRPGVSGLSDGATVIVGIRPEALSLGAGPQRLHATVGLVEALGAETVAHSVISAIAADVDDLDVSPLASDAAVLEAPLVARLPPCELVVGDQIEFAVDVSGIHFFDAESGVNLGYSA